MKHATNTNFTNKKEVMREEIEYTASISIENLFQTVSKICLCHVFAKNSVHQHTHQYQKFVAIQNYFLEKTRNSDEWIYTFFYEIHVTQISKTFCFPTEVWDVFSAKEND